jgi:hypothetical protein
MTISGRVAELHAAMAAQPASEVMGAFRREQAGLAAASTSPRSTLTPPSLPMPATVILDARHVVRWIDVHPDYSTHSEPQQIFDSLDRASL